jgi:hypothetical protein
MKHDIRLYNLTPGATEPDWSQYERLVIRGSVRNADDCEQVDLTDDFNNADFFTLYGIRAGQAPLGDGITDANSFPEMTSIAADLSALSGLPISVGDPYS